MATFKQLVGKCNKHGKYLILQVEETGFESAKVVGFYRSSKKPLDSQIFVSNLTLKNGCSSCGNCQLSGCSHASSKCGGVTGEYCPTCQHFSIDYTRTVGKSGQYGQYAGQNEVEGARDAFGNALGSQADLGRDGGFNGKKIVVLWLDDEPAIKGEDAKNNITGAVRSKGFVVDFHNYAASAVCSPAELRQMLSDACQLWVISNRSARITSQHVDVIADFFHLGRGLYLFGDNAPFFVDSNLISQRLFGISMSGDYLGDKVIGVSAGDNCTGIVRGHLISTGIQSFYEGITIATVQTNADVKPLVYNSERNVVTAYYDKDYKRCLIDGGFTRLFYKWNTAGTERFVKNCAAWLANVERFPQEYQ